MAEELPAWLNLSEFGLTYDDVDLYAISDDEAKGRKTVARIVAAKAARAKEKPSLQPSLTHHSTDYRAMETENDSPSVALTNPMGEVTDETMNETHVPIGSQSVPTSEATEDATDEAANETHTPIASQSVPTSETHGVKRSATEESEETEEPARKKARNAKKVNPTPVGGVQWLLWYTEKTSKWTSAEREEVAYIVHRFTPERLLGKGENRIATPLPPSEAGHGAKPKELNGLVKDKKTGELKELTKIQKMTTVFDAYDKRWTKTVRCLKACPLFIKLRRHSKNLAQKAHDTLFRRLATKCETAMVSRVADYQKGEKPLRHNTPNMPVEEDSE